MHDAHASGDDESAAEYLASLDDDLFPGQPDKDFVDTVTWSPQWNSSSRDDMVSMVGVRVCGGLFVVRVCGGV